MTTTQKRAKEIMGDQFITAEEASEKFGMEVSEKDIDSRVPYSEEQLKFLKKSGLTLSPCRVKLEWEVSKPKNKSAVPKRKIEEPVEA